MNAVGLDSGGDMAEDWLELHQHGETGIETIRAHFEGHAYDPHWHDSYLVGITLAGTQQFHCRRERHHSTPGDVFLLEPGEIHDGDAPVAGGFTYLTFYLEEQWLTRTLQGLFETVPSSYSLHFSRTIAREPQLAHAIAGTFHALSAQRGNAHCAAKYDGSSFGPADATLPVAQGPADGGAKRGYRSSGEGLSA
jgi:hypothetical protein